MKLAIGEDTPEGEVLLFILLSKSLKKRKPSKERKNPKLWVRDIFRKREQY